MPPSPRDAAELALVARHDVRCVLCFVGVFTCCLFVCPRPDQDYIKFGGHATPVDPADCTSDRSSLRWYRIVIVRYVIITPFVLLFFLVSYSKLFATNFWFGQFW